MAMVQEHRYILLRLRIVKKDGWQNANHVDCGHRCIGYRARGLVAEFRLAGAWDFQAARSPAQRARPGDLSGGVQLRRSRGILVDV